MDTQNEADIYPPVPHRWLEEAERTINDRLQPLIDKAEVRDNSFRGTGKK